LVIKNKFITMPGNTNVKSAFYPYCIQLSRIFLTINDIPLCNIDQSWKQAVFSVRYEVDLYIPRVCLTQNRVL